jgi:hypothetical protein
MIVSMRNSWRTALVAALWLGGCSDSDRPSGFVAPQGGTTSDPDPAQPSSGGDDTAGTSPGGGGATGDAGEAPIAGEPGEVGGADDGGDGGGDDGGSAGEPPYVEPFPDPICAGSGEVSGATKLGISTPDADQFGSITADELVIAWTVVDGAQVTLHYARRASLDDEFADAQSLTVPAAPDGVALSADGLRAVYTKADRKGFSQLVRASRDLPFTDLDSRDFDPIAESALQFSDDEYVGDPVLGADDMVFFYSRYGAGRTTTLLRTLRFSIFAPWPEGFELAVTPSLEATADDRQRPTGVSLDGQTLFVWDSVTSSQRVAELSHETSTYDVAYELGNVRGAAPNTACSRIYYDVDGDLWSADLL